MINRFFIFCFSFSFFIFFINEASENKKTNESFVISKSNTKKRISRNSLKRDIGSKVRDNLNYCAELNKQIGILQIELSEIQKKLFKSIESLINNKPPFKKATKTNLTETSHVLQHIRNSLSNQLGIVKNLRIDINKNVCLREKST